MSEAEQSRDTARDPRRDAGAGAGTDGDRGVVPAAREAEPDAKSGADTAPVADAEAAATDGAAEATAPRADQRDSSLQPKFHKGTP